VAKTRALHLSSLLYKSASFLQNKPNFKMGNINISTAKTKAYAKEQRTMINERYSKQSQIKANSKRRNNSVVRKIEPYRTLLTRREIATHSTLDVARDTGHGRLPRNDYRPGCSARLAAATLRRAFWAAHSHSAAGPSDPPLGPFAAARRVYSKHRRIDLFTVRSLTQNHRNFFHLNCVPRQSASCVSERK
jgi:hypothetical protein